MESMANGLPDVCSRIRGNVDLIDDEKGGYLVEPNNVEGFAKYINKLIINSQLRTEFGEFNLLKIKSYSVENVLSKMKENILTNIGEWCESITFN